MASYIGVNAAQSIKQAFRNLEKTIEVVFWDVQWHAFIKARDADWDTGVADEEWVYVDSGIGRLRENGLSGREASQDIIFMDSPYRLRTIATAPLTDYTWIVINDRFFRVDAFKPREGERTHANAYLTEVFHSDDVPVVP